MFESLVQAGHLDKSIGERMQKAEGFRNIAVHQYETIDWQVVYAICQYHLQGFARFAKAAYAALQQNNGN